MARIDVTEAHELSQYNAQPPFALAERQPAGPGVLRPFRETELRAKRSKVKRAVTEHMLVF